MNCTNRIAAALAAFAIMTTAPSSYSAENDLALIKTEITKRHDEAVKRLQDWIKQVSIAAEDRGYPEGAEYMAKLAKDAGMSPTAFTKGGFWPQRKFTPHGRWRESSLGGGAAAAVTDEIARLIRHCERACPKLLRFANSLARPGRALLLTKRV